MVSLKPGHMDSVRDFDFKLNLFSFPPLQTTTCSSDRFLTDHSGSYPPNRPLGNRWEGQSLAAAIVLYHKVSGTVYVLSWSTWSVQSAYVFKPEQSVYVVCVQVGLLNVLLLLWWCVTLMVMCYCYGGVLLLWWCVTVMVMCYCCGGVLFLWWCVIVMVMCYCYGDVLLLWWCVTVMVMCYCYDDVLLLWCLIFMVMCYCYGDLLLAPIPNVHKNRCTTLSKQK